MINREDMLELTRRMTPARTSFTRIAGCYVDADGDFDGSFNINFLKLSASEKTKNLAIAKTIPFAETNTPVAVNASQAASLLAKQAAPWAISLANRKSTVSKKKTTDK